MISLPSCQCGRSTFLDRWTFIFDVLNTENYARLTGSEVRAVLDSLDLSSVAARSSASADSDGDDGGDGDAPSGCLAALCASARPKAADQPASDQSATTSTASQRRRRQRRGVHQPPFVYRGRDVTPRSFANEFCRAVDEACKARATAANASDTVAFGLDKDELGTVLGAHPRAALLLWPFCIELGRFIGASASAVAAVHSTLHTHGGGAASASATSSSAAVHASPSGGGRSIRRLRSHTSSGVSTGSASGTSSSASSVVGFRS